MTLDPYASCPCGSGKKFKWCCQPIYPGIQQAWEQENNGQHENALRLIDKVTNEHGGNPEAWGQKAYLLAVNGKTEEADAALEQAFSINPNYPFGLRLRSQFRFAEGEYKGALSLARKAAEFYDADARDALAEILALTFECEMRCNRPVAARAALALAGHLAPGDEGLRQGLENVFGPKSRLPASARKPYAFRSPAASATGKRRDDWNRVLGSARVKLSEPARLFETLTKEDPTDGAAWYNLGLSKAWLGDNLAALEALDRAIELDADDESAVETATLCEVLRCGMDMEAQCDYHDHLFFYQFNRVEAVRRMLEEWQSQRRLLGIPNEQEGVLTALVLELSTTGLVTVGRPGAEVGRLAGYLLVAGNVLRISCSVKDTFDRLREEVRQKLSLGLTDLVERTSPPQFQEIVSEALIFPLNEPNEEAASARVLDHAGRFYEETWIHRPRKSLNDIAPVDAAGHARLRRKLTGVIRFLEECSGYGALARYEWDRLRRKLGLLGQAPAAGATGVTADLTAMSAAELAALKPEALSDEQLEKAYQTAYRLDAHELAGHFAEALVTRPVVAGKGDRYPWYAFLIQKALGEGETDAALDRVDEGLKLDCESNEGRRRNEYELFRAQVHGRRGEVEAAQDTYQRLIERTPRDFKIRGRAAEAMLSLKQPARALKFAEEGVTAAKQANDRGSEEYMRELQAAAKKQLG